MMTDEHKAELWAALDNLSIMTVNVQGIVKVGDVPALYEQLKVLHDAAIEPWCMLVRQQEALVPTRPDRQPPQRLIRTTTDLDF